MKVRTLKFNFGVNVVGALVPLAISLVTVPIYIRHIGEARYGVLSIVWVLLGYFGFLDLGLSRAAANALARLRHAPQESRARVLVTTLVMNLCMGTIGSVALYVTGSYLLQHVLAIPDALKGEVMEAFPSIVALIPLALVAGVGNGALESRERFGLANLIGVAGVALGQIVPVLLALLVSPSLTVIIPAAAATRFLGAACLLIVVLRSEGPLRLRHFDPTQVVALLRYGGWVSVSGLINPLLTSTDQFVIGSVLGVATVPTYSVPMTLVLRSQVFPGALSRALFPRLSSIRRDEAQHLASRAFTTVSFGYATVCAPAMALTPLFFSVWINPDFATTAAPVAEILFFGAWFNALAFVPFSLLQSQGRPDITGKFHAIEVVPFVAILYVLTKTYGVQGAAGAWALRCLADGLLLFVAARMPARDLCRAVAPLLLLAIAGFLALWSGTDRIAAVVAALALGSAAALITFVMANDLRAAALRLPALLAKPWRADRLDPRLRNPG